MDTEALANIIVSFIALGFLFYLVFIAYQNYRTDRFRHDVFRLRDELFYRAADGFISFDNEAYLLMRTIMNGYIRYAHRLSIFDPFFMWFIERVRGPLPRVQSFEAEYERVTAHLTEEQKEVFEGYRNTLNTLVVKHVTRALPEVVIVFLAFLAIQLWLSIWRLLSRTRRSLDIEKALEHRVADMALEFGRQ